MVWLKRACRGLPEYAEAVQSLGAVVYRSRPTRLESGRFSSSMSLQTQLNMLPKAASLHNKCFTPALSPLLIQVQSAMDCPLGQAICT